MIVAGETMIVAGDTCIWRDMVSIVAGDGGKYVFTGHYARGERIFPPFLKWLNTDAVNGIIVRGNTSSKIERMQQEVLDCL